MNHDKHTVLCVDDEQNILNALKRLLRKDGYRLLTASSGDEGVRILEQNEVHVVISDQRMPDMSGMEFLARVKECYPDALRIVLTGYTEVDSITESINKGHIYKFFLKPWNDQSLRLEIKQALDHYDLIQANKKLQEQVMQQNKKLKEINENLEAMVQERTEDLRIQNQALELSHAILEDIPVAIVGVSAEGGIVLINKEAQSLSGLSQRIELGNNLNDYFSTEVDDKMATVLSTNTFQTLKDYPLSGVAYDINLAPLSGRFCGKGVVVTLRKAGD
jgi:response regulator RpfG family c-di-GMP phosphodiesterase